MVTVADNTTEKAQEFAQALVSLYDEIDGVADEMSSRDCRLTQEFYFRVEEARRYLLTPPGKDREGG